MNVRHSNRVIAALVVAALAISTVAPAVQADPGRGKGRDKGRKEYRQKNERRGPDRHVERRREEPRRVESRRGSSKHVEYRRSSPRQHVETRVVYQPRRVVKYVDYRPYRVVRHARYHRPHHDGSAFAFIGGLLLGAVITHAAHADHYYYADPYCDLRFSSLRAYDSHFAHHHHPRVVHVVEIRTGDWVDSYRYHHGDWRYYQTDVWCD
jgi:hypothetical protein